MPKTSFKTAQTKLWWRNVPRGWRTMNEKMGSRFTFCDELPSKISSGIVRTWARTCLRERTRLRLIVNIALNYPPLSSADDPFDVAYVTRRHCFYLRYLPFANEPV